MSFDLRVGVKHSRRWAKMCIESVRVFDRWKFIILHFGVFWRSKIRELTLLRRHRESPTDEGSDGGFKPASRCHRWSLLCIESVSVKKMIISYVEGT